jgi:aminopeptidase C
MFNSFISWFSKTFLNKSDHHTIDTIYKAMGLNNPLNYQKVLHDNLSNMTVTQTSNNLTYNTIDRQTGKSTFTIVAALAQSQHSQVVIVGLNRTNLRQLMTMFYSFAHKANVDVKYMVSFLTIDELCSHDPITTEFCVPFVDPVCYTNSPKLNT